MLKVYSATFHTPVRVDGVRDSDFRAPLTDMCADPCVGVYIRQTLSNAIVFVPMANVRSLALGPEASVMLDTYSVPEACTPSAAVEVVADAPDLEVDVDGTEVAEAAPPSPTLPPKRRGRPPKAGK